MRKHSEKVQRHEQRKARERKWAQPKRQREPREPREERDYQRNALRAQSQMEEV